MFPVGMVKEILVLVILVLVVKMHLPFQLEQQEEEKEEEIDEMLMPPPAVLMATVLPTVLREQAMSDPAVEDNLLVVEVPDADTFHLVVVAPDTEVLDLVVVPDTEALGPGAEEQELFDPREPS